MRRIALIAVALCASSACGDDESSAIDAGVRDAQVDATATSGAGLDAAVDAGARDAQLDSPGSDAGLDATAHDGAAVDTGMDSTEDAGGGDADVAVDCSAAVTCPVAAVDKVTVCGRLHDVETDAEIRALVPTAAGCGSGFEATDGPCELAIRFYDALAFAGDPLAAAPLAVGSLDVDDCGRFIADGVALPAFGQIAVVVDDAVAAPDGHRLTVVTFDVSAGEVHDDEKAYVVRRSTDAKWSTDVGFGATTFVDRGTLMSIFRHGTTPVAGVTVTSSGSVRAADDYYFTNTDANVRSTATATGPTGTNGASLLLNSVLAQHSGLGAEPSGCLWPDRAGAALGGVLWVVSVVAESSGGGQCP